ncbi:unnamed protein product [Ascophyllum nodosum]
MRSHVLLLLFLAMMTLVHPSCAESGSRPRRRRGNRKAGQIKGPSQHDKDMVRLRLMKMVSQEMPDANEEEIIQRVDELTEARLKEAFPEFYLPKPQAKQFSKSDDIWENGTVVRYIARAMMVILAIAGFIAFKEQLLGRQTFDGRRIVRAAHNKKDKKDKKDK